MRVSQYRRLRAAMASFPDVPHVAVFDRPSAGCSASGVHVSHFTTGVDTHQVRRYGSRDVRQYDLSGWAILGRPDDRPPPSATGAAMHRSSTERRDVDRPRRWRRSSWAPGAATPTGQPRSACADLAEGRNGRQTSAPLSAGRRREKPGGENDFRSVADRAADGRARCGARHRRAIVRASSSYVGAYAAAALEPGSTASPSTSRGIGEHSGLLRDAVSPRSPSSASELGDAAADCRRLGRDSGGRGQNWVAAYDHPSERGTPDRPQVPPGCSAVGLWADDCDRRSADRAPTVSQTARP